MIEDVGAASAETIERLLALRAEADAGAAWDHVSAEDRDYQTAFFPVESLAGLCPDLDALWAPRRWNRAFLMDLPPGGSLHRHADTDDVYTSFHVPIETNGVAVIRQHDPDRYFWLKVGRVYAFDRTRVHSSRNDGARRRTHLIVEVLK